MPKSVYTKRDIDDILAPINTTITTMLESIEEVGRILEQLATTPPPTLQVHDGNLKIREDNTHLAGVHIKGTLYLEGSNITVTNCLITGDTGEEMMVRSFTRGNLNNHLIGCTIRPVVDVPDRVGVSGFANVQNCHITGCVDGIQLHAGDNAIIRGNLINNPRFYKESRYHAEGSHSDGIQVFAGENHLIVGNEIDTTLESTSAIMVTPSSPINGLTINENRLTGNAAAAINISEKDQGPIEHLTVTNNRIGRGYKTILLIPGATAEQPTNKIEGNVA